jgi:hypothetical protein
VSHFYWWLSTWTQCKVACAELNRTDCCTPPVSAQCNVPWYLDRALTRTKNFDRIDSPATFAQIRAEIDAGRPVGARIGWSGGGGHFLVIYGYSRLLFSEDYLDVDDPIYGKSHLSFNDFSTNYQGSGTWTHTYFTKSYFKLPWVPILVQEPTLRRIWEMREVLRLKQANDPVHAERRADDDLAEIGLAHRVYALGLDVLTGSSEDGGPQPIGLRVYESKSGIPTAFFDVDDSTEEASVRQMSAASAHLEPFAQALEIAVPIAEESERDCELRIFRIPALNFEALWISYEDHAGDQLIPLTAVGQLTPGDVYSYSEALESLREAAAPLVDMDDTMGA